MFQWLEQPDACFDFRRNHQLLPTRCRIRCRSRLSQTLWRMRSARHLALRWLQCGVAPIQHSLVRSMWCSGDLFPLQVPFDTREPGTPEISWTIRRLAARCCHSIQISWGVGTSSASKRASSGCGRAPATHRCAHPGAAAPRSTASAWLQPIATARPARRRLARSRGQGCIDSYAPY